MRQTEKPKYRVRNWPQYNAALVQRGSLTVWVDEAIAQSWKSQAQTGERGHPEVYKDSWIELILTLGMVYHLPLRQLEGFMQSLLSLAKWQGVKVPDFTTLSRRRKELNIRVSERKFSEAITVVVDSSGAKVYGEGEWKVRQHGASKRRTWRKFHLAIEPETNEILSLEVSTNDVTDDEMLPTVLEGIDEAVVVEQVCGDGGYDRTNSYQAIAKRKAKATIPPHKDAKIRQHGNSLAPPLARDENLRTIRKHGCKRWKQTSGYHQRSKAETGVLRYKTILGDSLNARLFESQCVEMKLGGKILNRMASLALPVSVAVTA
jgi:Transposase DDE domain